VSTAPPVTTHDVFISYANRDKSPADAVCHALEAADIRVWIAPREVPPGTPWAQAIVEAIAACRVMVVVFSSESNCSDQVIREVERAVHHGLVIVPLRIEDVLPTKSMEYFLSTPHWLDALTPPFEAHVERLVRAVKSVLSGTERTPFDDIAQAAFARSPNRAAAPLGSEDERLLPMLRDRVRQFWIEGVLKSSVHRMALLTLGKTSRAEAVDHPWERVLELPTARGGIISPDKHIGAVFEESGRSLLILGEPGSGKTTTLLELAASMLERAQADSGSPVPVVFSL
jgi:hypothetical protein